MVVPDSTQSSSVLCWFISVMKNVCCNLFEA